MDEGAPLLVSAVLVLRGGGGGGVAWRGVAWRGVAWRGVAYVLMSAGALYRPCFACGVVVAAWPCGLMRGRVNGDCATCAVESPST